MSNLAVILIFMSMGLILVKGISDRVAFDAQMKNAPTLEVGKNMVFDQVNLDVGITSAYNYTDGVFTAPVCGIYSFSVLVTSKQKDAVSWNLENVDGNVYATALANSWWTKSSTAATVNAVVILKEGDKVRVKHVANHGDVRCDPFTCPRFSGFLIKSLD